MTISIWLLYIYLFIFVLRIVSIVVLYYISTYACYICIDLHYTCNTCYICIDLLYTCNTCYICIDLHYTCGTCYIWNVISLDIYFSLGIIHFHEKEASLICSTFSLQWFTCIEWVIESYYIHIQCLLTVMCIQKCVYVIHDRIFVYILWLYTTNAIYVFITVAATTEKSWMTWCMIQ
jgi:hypothetical protein